MQRIFIILLLLVNIFLVLLACKNNSTSTKKIDPNEAAIPHGSALPQSNLSQEDRQKLEEASGIIATPMKVHDLVHLIDKGSQGLNIYCLWQLNCPECDTILRHLSRIKEEFDDSIIAIHHININVLDHQNKVNSHIRALGLINNNYILSGLEDYEINQPYSKLFHSDLPILIFANNQDETKLIYKQAFTFEELYALVLPLTI